jgi:hypothetical protein
MNENPAYSIFAARFDVESGIGKLKQTKQDNIDNLDPSHILMLEQAQHDLWEVCKRLIVLEDYV